jgi:dTDP-4-amino-4,6-dideoxygalactose transaminase
VLSDQSERIEAALKANDIESRRYYSNLAYKQPAYNVNVSLPNTEYYSRMNLAIPTHQFLLDSEVELIADIVKRELK